MTDALREAVQEALSFLTGPVITPAERQWAEHDRIVNALRAALAAPPKRKPLTDDEIWADDGIMAENATAGLMLLDLVHLVRAVERAHGIVGGVE